MEFLGLPQNNLTNPKTLNKSNYDFEMEDTLRKKLLKFFKPYNEQLYELIGKRFDWNY